MSSKVFIVAFEFYPFNTGGSHRPFRLANFLCSQGFDIEVITQTFEGKEIDQSLLELLGEVKYQITRISLDDTPRNSKSYYFTVEDSIYRRWKSKLWSYLSGLLVNQETTNIIITLPPFSLGSLVIDLRQQYSKINIICDFRDAWSQWNVSPYASRLHYKRRLKKEKKIISSSSAVLSTSRVTQDDFIKLHSEKGKLHVVHNSFDKYFAHPELLTYVPNDKLKIGYVGSFYFNSKSHQLMFAKWYHKKPYQYFQYVPFLENWLYRTPYFLFRIVKEIINFYPEYRDKLEINIAGEQPYWLSKMIDEFGLRSIVRLHGFIKKKEVIDFQRGQDFLLLTSSKRIGKSDYSIAGKSFEYLSLMKPILACVTNGAQKDLLHDLGCSVILDPDNMENSKSILLNILQNGCALEPNYEIIDKYLTKNALQPILKLIR